MSRDADLDYLSDDEPYYTQPMKVPLLYNNRNPEDSFRLLKKEEPPKRKHSKLQIGEDIFT